MPRLWTETLCEAPAGQGTENMMSRFESKNRRMAKRYPLCQIVEYRQLNSVPGPVAGQGRTINIGSGGVLFTTEEPLQVGQPVEVLIEWPACTDGTCALRLVTLGEVVRSEDRQAAVQFQRHEFRTRGQSQARSE